MSGGFRLPDFEHFEVDRTPVVGLPVDRLADRQAEQRAASRREYGHLAGTLLRIAGIDESQLVFPATGLFAKARLAVHGDHVARHVLRFAYDSALQFIAQAIQVAPVASGGREQQALQALQVA
ncbi:hypothetical protein ebA1301 [Aromatoleum aromaticum EbN1]|uniref:Uncharacterized protein n=1 Tax=Aromatoleum aromaticum (strain DSM 19018 / LMG 30748 / EbN1) TaxID=76114 RepID=Q5P788_AROAE|nr:hypothetical protein ebA1301 [Aromatoleum aromaticum EbN1]